MEQHPHRHPELPLDPDTAADDPPGRGAPPSPRAPYRDPRAIALVFLGGTLGTGTREALSLALPAVDGVAWTIAGINICGAFLLGLLLERLARRGPDRGRNRRLRLLLGTGFMGGFTTYSTLATDTAVLLGDGRAAPAVAHALGTVLVGAAATWCGIVAGARR
ncbi:hypothetical protein GCM10028820_00400 [Tessaracoccus terricola]